MLSALKQIFSPSPIKHQAYDTYVKLVEQSRQPVFYRELQVEDSIDGRFDIIVLHIFLVLTRCEQGASAQASEFAKFVSEAFFADMDRSLREMGVSDTGVSIRIKKMAQAYYGRMSAYKEAVHDETALAEALKRNVYRERDVPPQVIASLASYANRNERAIAGQPLEAILSGDVKFSS